MTDSAGLAGRGATLVEFPTKGAPAIVDMVNRAGTGDDVVLRQEGASYLVQWFLSSNDVPCLDRREISHPTRLRPRSPFPHCDWSVDCMELYRGQSLSFHIYDVLNVQIIRLTEFQVSIGCSISISKI